MIRDQVIEIVKQTAPAVAAHAEAITRRFYELMFTGNPEVQAYFNQAHQHSGNQQRALAGAICAYAANIDNLEALGPAVELIAQKHCSLGIEPHHYPIVGQHLLTAIQDVLGDAITPEILSAWEEAYRFLADAFIDREKRIYEQQANSPGGWKGYRRFIVKRKVPESSVVTSFYLKPVDGRNLPEFLPGQYVTVKINGVATSPRNYSLSDRPNAEHLRISVKREPRRVPQAPAGLVSNYLHDHIQPGDAIELGPPCGNFAIDVGSIGNRPLVLISGGIGITPLLSMLKALAESGATNPVYFIHAARNSAVHAFRHEVSELAKSRPNVHVHFCYDAPAMDDVAERRCDSAGFVDLSLLQQLLPTKDCEFYFCGPKPFMAGLYKNLRQWDVDESQLHLEFFGPREELIEAA